MSVIGNYIGPKLTKEQIEKIKKLEAAKIKSVDKGKVILKKENQ